MKLIRLLPVLLLAGALWPAGAVRGEDTPALEFRGVMQLGTDVKVGLFERNTGLTVWVKVPTKPSPPSGIIATGLTVREYDPARNRLTVDYLGHTYTLVLKEAVILFEPIPPPPPPAPDPAALPAEPATGGGEVPRRRALTQVEILNQILRDTGTDESQLLQGNPPLEPAESSPADAVVPE